jgi:hypothetical protein
VFNDFINGEKLEKKTSAMTAPVGVDEDGKLWTSGGGSGETEDGIIWKGEVGSEPVEVGADAGAQIFKYLEFLDIKINNAKLEYSNEYLDGQTGILSAEYYGTIDDNECGLTIDIDLAHDKCTLSAYNESETETNVTIKIPTKAIINCFINGNDIVPTYALGSIINLGKIGIQPVIYFEDTNSQTAYACGSISVSRNNTTFVVDGSVKTFEGSTVNYSSTLLSNFLPCLHITIGGVS